MHFFVYLDFVLAFSEFTAIKRMGNIPSHWKKHQVGALKLILVNSGLKIKNEILEDFWNDVLVLATWIALENMWEPHVRMGMYFLDQKHEVSPRVTPSVSLIPILVAIIASHK